MRVAIVHDWFYVLGGAERVVKEILRCYPGADVYALFDTLTDEERTWIGFKSSTTSFLQRIPRIDKIHRHLLPLMPFAVEQFDLSRYDLVISSSAAVAKGIITGPDQVHIAYVHSPMRYAWDLQHQYLREARGFFGLRRALTRVLLHRIRTWDTVSGTRPNAIVANSHYVARRIKKAFGRDVEVVYPPVDVAPGAMGLPRGDHFLTAGRLVGYKNTKAVIEAFRLLPEQKLVIAGTGPQEKALRQIAGPNVTFAGRVSDEEMRRLMASAKALVFAAEEDFGIVPVEAQAEGTPVLALGRGGARETVSEGRSGLFFARAEPSLIAACVESFLSRQSTFTREACQKQARSFSAKRFQLELKSIVDREIRAVQGPLHTSRIEAAAPRLLVPGE